VSGLAVLVLAQLLAASPEAAEPPERDLPAATLRLAEARATWSDTLGRSGFREDAPAMRALAETLAPLLADTWRRHRALRSQAVELMQATAGDGLRPFLDSIPGMRFALARSWLRWHDEPEFLSVLSPSEHPGLLRVLSLYRPERAVAPLGPLLRDSDPAFGRDGLCHTALLLPTVERRAFLDAAIGTLVAQAPRDNWPSCIRLALEHPTGRRWLQSAVVDPRNAPNTTLRERWAPIAAALLTASGPVDPRVLTRLAGWSDYFHSTADGPSRRDLVTALEHQSPAWPATSAARRAPVLAFLRATGNEAVRLWPLRRSLGDPTLFRDALVTLSSPSVNPITLAEAVRVVGLTAPLDPSARAEAVEALDLLRSRLRPWAIDSVSPREIDRWRAAVEGARPCEGEGCAATLETASDPLAARTVMLGAPLESAAVARVVVRRVVVAGESFFTSDGVVTSASALAAVVLTGAPSCPPALRGLATVRPAIVGRARTSWLDPWRERLIARCTLEARRP
jgi:hypothetical protein